MVRGEEFPGNGKKGGRFAYAFIGLHTIYYLKFTIFLLNNFIGKLKFSFRRRILNLYDIIWWLEFLKCDKKVPIAVYLALIADQSAGNHVATLSQCNITLHLDGIVHV